MSAQHTTNEPAIEQMTDCDPRCHIYQKWFAWIDTPTGHHYLHADGTLRNQCSDCWHDTREEAEAAVALWRKNTTNEQAGKGKWEVGTNQDSRNFTYAHVSREIDGKYEHLNVIAWTPERERQLAAEVRDALNGYEAVREALKQAPCTCHNPDGSYPHDVNNTGCFLTIADAALAQGAQP